MSDLDDSMANVEKQMKEATDKFTEATHTEDPAGIVRSFGEMITGVSHATGDVGDGIGEALEEGAQKGFHSEGFGTGFLQETGEAFLSVSGEFAEGIAEASAGVGEAAGVMVGGVIEAVGGAAENLWDAGKAVAHGDIGDAAEHVYEAGRDVVGLAGTAFDTVGAAVSAGGELVEGVAATAWEVGEGAVEMTVGLGNDIAHGAEAVWDWATGDE